MKKLLLSVLLVPFISISQVQIGQDIDGEGFLDFSGSSISLSSDGTIVAIGAERNDGNGEDSGHVRVFKNLNNVWTQIGEDIYGEAAFDYSGTSVSLSSNGTIIAIGARLNDGTGNSSGHVRVFENINNVWIQIGEDIDGEAAGDFAGESVSLSSDGTIIAVGADRNDGNGSFSGHVRMFENINDTWTQIGEDIDGEDIDDNLGVSVSLSSNGNIVAIGGERNDGNGSNSGHVRIFENINNVWTQIGEDIDGEAQGDLLGRAVSLSSDGTIVAIGGERNDGNGEDSGHVRVFENINNVWTQIGEDIDGEAEGDFFGGAVSLSSDGTIMAIGARLNDGNGEDSGHARVFKNINNVWTQIGEDIDGEVADDSSGTSVSLSSNGTIIAIGARLNDGNAGLSGHVRVYDLSDALSINEISTSKFALYPNPTKNQFTIQLRDNSQLQKVTIYNNLGQFVSTSKEHIINTSHLSQGLYVVKVKTTKGTTSQKLIIE